MVDLSIVRDPRSDAEIKLDRLRAKSSDIDRRLRNMFGQRIVGHIQKDYLRGQVLRRGKGKLAAHTAAKDDGLHSTFVGVYGLPYARIHELSGDIYPKNKKCLRFKVKTHIVVTYGKKSGKLIAHQKYSDWIFTKHVHIPARPYIRPAIEHYFDSDMAARDANKWLQQELDKVGG